MKKLYIPLLLVILLSSCRSNQAQKSNKRDSLPEADTVVFDESIIDTLKLGLKFNTKRSYSTTKIDASTKRSEFYRLYSKAQDPAEKKKVIDSARYVFTDFLLNEIVPHWYGTVWDFDGYTEKPNKGVIACGYFVSTTLKHIGLNMNRYKFAQQWGINEARTLQPDSSLRIYDIESTYDVYKVIDTLEKTLKDGLYFVGLSNHVGYVYLKNHTLYFLHSNYIDGYVMIEKARYSNAFRSMIYVIADITHNDSLIKKWITNEFIPVVKKPVNE